MDFPIVLSQDLFPAQAFFNAMSDRSLMSTLESFSRGVGAGFNDAVCEFPDEIEEGDEVFVGVKFYIFEEELVVPSEDFLGILTKVCNLFISRHPEEEEQVRSILQLIRNKLLG